MNKNSLIKFFTALGLLFCMSALLTPIDSVAETSVAFEPKASFSSKEVKWFNKKGSLTIKGQAQVQGEGYRVSCEGRLVHLMPSSNYGRERVKHVYGNLVMGRALRLDIAPADPKYLKTEKKTQCDVDGSFVFTDLPAGDYFVFTSYIDTRSPTLAYNIMKAVTIDELNKVTQFDFIKKFDSKDRFVFVEKSLEDQAAGYRQIFSKVDVVRGYQKEILDYQSFVGKLGTIEPDPYVPPELVGRQSSKYYAMQIDEFDELFFYEISNGTSSHPLDEIGARDLIRVDDLERLKAPIGTPVIPNSKVLITGVDQFSRNTFYVGTSLEPFGLKKLEMLKAILRISKDRSYDEQLVEVFSKYVLSYDRFDQVYVLSPAQHAYRQGSLGRAVTDLLELGPSGYDMIEDLVQFELFNAPRYEIQSKLTKAGKLDQRVQIQFVSDSYRFINSIAIVAGDQLFKSEVLEFNRDHDERGVWEWVYLNLDSRFQQISEEILSDNEAMIRFYGSEYNIDHIFREDEKSRIKDALLLKTAFALDR